MSLRVDDDRNVRARSRSRTRDRSRSDVSRTLGDAKPTKSSSRRETEVREPRRSSTMPGSFAADEEASIGMPPSEERGPIQYAIREPKPVSSAGMPAMPASAFDDDLDSGDDADGLAYGFDDKKPKKKARPQSHSFVGPGGVPYPADPHYMPNFPVDPSDSFMRTTKYSEPDKLRYANLPQYRYGAAPDKITRSTVGTSNPDVLDTFPSLGRSKSTSDAGVRSSRDDKDDKKRSNGESKRSSRLSVSEASYEVRAPSPSGRDRRSERLSVSGQRPDLGGGGYKPPASPLLEAYHGTYQQASPMPSPMMLPQDLDDLDSFSLLDSRDDDKQGKKKKSKKSVKLYDAEGDAKALAKALNHHEARPGPLVEILPDLTHDQILHLRDEYKKIVKTSGRGVNIAKQIKMTTSGNFGKVVYATALGKWESESYWANFWYQSGSANRELLIEALMGRSNADIREIKAGFRDKRYDDDLARCMERELKPDKFRTAVLMALKGRRQEETDVYPVEYRNKDVDTMFNALRSREGGESAILQLVVTRSDTHLRECLKAFEQVHGINFAREALRKSNNLVGEVIAHILNGVINRVARDTLLLHHAIEDIANKEQKVAFRYELLMSRLIRLHWERLHFGRVKQEYRRKYHVELEEDIEETTKGDFRDFLGKLCESA